MATKTIHVSDLSGDVLADGDTTLSWAFDGQAFEIDLTATEREKFTKAVAPFIEASRKAGRKATPARSTNASDRGRQVTGTELDNLTGAERKARLDEIRAWAPTAGHEVSARGRLPLDVIHEFYGIATEADA